MLVLSSPSGAGKTTLSRRLLESDKNITLSVSCTTRARRATEREGADYYFVAVEQFERMVQGGEFLEHAQVFGNRYGTPRAACFPPTGSTTLARCRRSPRLTPDRAC